MKQRQHKTSILFLFIFLMAVLCPKFVLAAESNVELEWESVPNAKGYDLEVKSTKNTFKFQTKQSLWAGRLSPGFFKMRVRALDKRGVPGEWSEFQEFKVYLESPEWISPTSGSTISSSNSETQSVTLKWKKSYGGKKYIVDLQGVDSSFNQHLEVIDDKIALDLPVANKFSATIRTANEVLTSNPETDQVSEFIVSGPKLRGPKFIPPESLFIREIKWNKSQFAQSYSYVLEKMDSQTQKFSFVEENKDVKEEKMPFKKEWPGGVYRISLKAHGPYRPSSDAVTLRFTAKDGDRSEKAEELARLRESIERLSGWFVMASSLINSVNYENNNYDLTNTQTSYEAIGATLRAGFGYATLKDPWGYFIAVESSSLNVTGFGDIQYNVFELNSYFKMKPNDAGEFRQTAGLIYKELPDLAVNKARTVKNTSSNAGLGLRYGVEYWHAMTSKVGLQVNAHVFPLLIGQKTTNGQELKPTLSFQAGFLMSYRWSKNLTMLGGYAYRTDRMEYRSQPSAALSKPTSDTNSAILKGHYINLFLEYQL